jgi:hypothetical protein
VPTNGRGVFEQSEECASLSPLPAMRFASSLVTLPNSLAYVVHEEPSAVAMGQPDACSRDAAHRSIGLIMPRSQGAVNIGREHFARDASFAVHAPRKTCRPIQLPRTCRRFRARSSGRADPAWS